VVTVEQTAGPLPVVQLVTMAVIAWALHLTIIVRARPVTTERIVSIHTRLTRTQLILDSPSA